MLWDRERDEFTMGQWLNGRIYERRSDLSPDGRFFIYFAMNGKWKSEAKGSWTAISLAPYLKAIALFAKGDCWHGGGLFTGRKKYWLNDGHGHSVLRNTTLVYRDSSFEPTPSFGGECLGVYYPRLLRDGWKFVDRLEVSRWKHRDIFDKPAHGSWILRKIAHSELNQPEGKGCYWDEHQLVHQESGYCISCPNWEWAEIDGRRLVWADDGKLNAGQLRSGGLTSQRVLFDFTDLKFEPIRAPY